MPKQLNSKTEKNKHKNDENTILKIVLEVVAKKYIHKWWEMGPRHEVPFPTVCVDYSYHL